MKKIETTVTYIDRSDLNMDAQNKEVYEVCVTDIKDRQVMLRSDVIILKIGFSYGVLKSKY